MAAACQQVRLVADLTMNVPRDAAGDLECGAERLLTGIDAVDDVDSVDVTNLTPRLNDLQIEATVAVGVAVDDARVGGDVAGDVADPGVDAASDALADGFGVTAVENARADRANTGSETTVEEVG